MADESASPASDDLPAAHVGDEADDLEMTPRQHAQMGHAYVGAAHDAIDKAAGHFAAAHPEDHPEPAEADHSDDSPRHFPGSAQARRGFEPGSVRAETARAMRPR